MLCNFSEIYICTSEINWIKYLLIIIKIHCTNLKKITYESYWLLIGNNLATNTKALANCLFSTLKHELLEYLFIQA